MERLTIDEVIAHCKRHTERMENHSGRMQLEETPIGNSNIMKQYWEHRQVAEWLEQLKDYRDAEEQGLLLRLPVFIGDIVYRINEYADKPIIPMGVTSIEIKGITDTFNELECKECVFGGEFKYRFSDIGKTVFLTKEEAEQALKRMEEE